MYILDCLTQRVYRLAGFFFGGDREAFQLSNLGSGTSAIAAMDRYGHWLQKSLTPKLMVGILKPGLVFLCGDPIGNCEQMLLLSKYNQPLL